MKRLKWLASSFAILMSTFVTSAKAEAQVNMAVSPGFGAVSPWWWGGGGGGSYGGGTADGNYLSGLSQVIRAEGEYNQSTSAGLINYEEARSKYIDNTNRWTQAYFQMREANQAFQIQKMQRNRRSPEAIAQAAATERPRTLSSNELDPVTGKITWPEALMDGQYANLRNDLEDLLQARARMSGSPGTRTRIREDARLMMSKLRENVKSMPANEFIAARKFIDALDYAAIAPAMAAASTTSSRPIPMPPAPDMQLKNADRLRADAKKPDKRTSHEAPVPVSHRTVEPTRDTGGMAGF